MPKNNAKRTLTHNALNYAHVPSVYQRETNWSQESRVQTINLHESLASLTKEQNSRSSAHNERTWVGAHTRV